MSTTQQPPIIQNWPIGFGPDDPLGVWRDMPDDIYHADDTALSASSAKILLGKRPPTSTGALEFGTLAHTVLMEPERLTEYVRLDAAAIAGTNKKTGRPYDAPHMTARYKDAVAEVEADGYKVVDQAEWDKAHALADAVRKHPTASVLLDIATERELSVYAEHETGALVRGRLDLYGPGVVVDYKTTSDANPDGWGVRAHSFGYYISAANYLDLAKAAGLDVEGFAFINAEKEPTLTGRYRVSVTQLTDRAIAKGRADMAEACRRWLALDRVVDRPDYGAGFHTCDLPAYAYRDHADEYEELNV